MGTEIDKRIGKKFKIYFQDRDKVLPKFAIIIAIDSIFITIQNTFNGTTEILPMARVLRMEEIL